MSQTCSRTLRSGKELVCAQGLFSSDWHASSEQQDELFAGTSRVRDRPRKYGAGRDVPVSMSQPLNDHRLEECNIRLRSCTSKQMEYPGLALA